MNEHIDKEHDGDVIDYGVLFAKLWETRWWLIVATLLSTTIFTIVALYTTPVYRASVLLMSASAERNNMSGSLSSALGQLGGLASLVGGGGINDAGTEEALAVLHSRQFTGAFIADKHLMPVLFSKQWDAANNSWKDPIRKPTESKAYKYFNEVRSVVQDKKTGLITIQIDWTDRSLAAEWANELVERLNAEMRSRAIEKADASLGYLQKELVSTQVLEVREAINRLIEAQIKQRMLANVTQEYSFRVVDKAVVPDRSDRLKPNKLILVAVGPVVGLAIGVLIVFIANFVSGLRRPRAPK